jgi:hypothetical protein
MNEIIIEDEFLFECADISECFIDTFDIDSDLDFINSNLDFVGE